MAPWWAALPSSPALILSSLGWALAIGPAPCSHPVGSRREEGLGLLVRTTCYRLTGEVEPCFSLQMGTPACCRSSKPRSVWSAASACGPDRAGLLRGRDVAMQERVQPARCSHLPQSVPNEHLHEESQCVTRDIPRLLFQVTALPLVSVQ